MSREHGQTVIEYAMLAFFVAIAAFILLGVIGVDLLEMFDDVEDVTGVAGNGGEPIEVPSDDDASEANARP